MLSHIATDLQQVYLEEVFTPQLGKPGASTPAKPKSSPAKPKSSPAKPKSSSDLDGDGDVDSFEKKVRQIIYDVRHIMKDENVSAEEAFKKRTLKTGFSAEMVDKAKEKLGIKGGTATSVSEETLSEDDKVGIVVNYKNGTTYRKSVSRDSVQTELQKFRSNPNVSSVERTGYGLSKRDYDGDGKIEDPSKEHAGSVHNAIQKATGGTPDGQDTRGKTSKKKLKTYGVSEGFSNWREDLREVADELKTKKRAEIKEDPSINNKVTINPEFQEQINILDGAIVEEFELDEEYINETVNIATDFFYNCGLNENGVDIVIEELGKETFAEFVFELSEEYFLTEELKKSESNVKTSKAPKGTKQYATTIARVKKQGGTKMSTKNRIASTFRKDRVKTAVKSAEKTQAPSSGNNTKDNVRNVIGSTLNTVARGALSLHKGHKAAMRIKGEGGSLVKQLAGGAGSALGNFLKKGTKQFKEWVEYLISEGYDLSDWTTEELYEEYGYLCEEEEIGQNAPVDPKDRAVVASQKRQVMAKLQQLNKGVPLAASYTPEGEMVDEQGKFRIIKTDGSEELTNTPVWKAPPAAPIDPKIKKPRKSLPFPKSSKYD
jgi:hypothetical protein